MVTATQPLTYKDLEATPEGDGNRYELLGGELFVTPSPARNHVFVSNRLYRALSGHVEKNRLGETFHGPADVNLTPFDVVVPDILFLRSGRMNIFGNQLIDGPPDLIVEILSPSTRLRDLNEKLRLYARTGVAEYWIVDVDERTITVHALLADGGYSPVAQKRGGITSLVLPDLKVSLSRIFSGLD